MADALAGTSSCRATSDEEARVDAATLVRDVDAADASALADMVNAVLQHGPASAAWVFADELAEVVSDLSVLADVRTLLDAYVQGDPASVTAAAFVSRFLP